MAVFYYDTKGKMLEIFAEHCNLSLEQYEEISGRFIDLVADYQDGTPQAEIDQAQEKLRVIFEFLYNTKELTLEEFAQMNDMISEMEKQAKEIAARAVRKAIQEGTVL